MKVTAATPLTTGHQNNFQRIHLVDVRHAQGGEHGKIHDANSTAEIASIDRN
jgi:hypothetical protein